MSDKMKYKFYIFFFFAIISMYLTYNYMHGHYSEAYIFAEKFSNLKTGMTTKDIEDIYPKKYNKWLYFQDIKGKEILAIFPKKFEIINESRVSDLSGKIDSATNLSVLSNSIIFLFDQEGKVRKFGWSYSLAEKFET